VPIAIITLVIFVLFLTVRSELSDKGTKMVEVARDILEKADPYRAHILTARIGKG